MFPNLKDPNLEIKLKIWDAILKSLTALVVIVTAIVGVSQYLRQRQELIEQNKRYQEQRTKDFNSSIYHARVDTYIEVTDTLARFARARDVIEAEKAATRFWELYHGKTSLFEDNEVNEVVRLSADFLERWETCKKAPPPDVFQDLTYDLSQACRGSLAKVFPDLNPLNYGEGESPVQPPDVTPDMIKEVCGK